MGRWRGYAIISMTCRYVASSAMFVATNDRRSIRIKRASTPPPLLNLTNLKLRSVERATPLGRTGPLPGVGLLPGDPKNM